MNAEEARKLATNNGKFFELVREVTDAIRKSASCGGYSCVYYLEDWRPNYSQRLTDLLTSRGYHGNLVNNNGEIRIEISWLTDS